MNVDKVAYDTSSEPYHGFTVRASYLKEPNNGDAQIEIFQDGLLLSRYRYPAYRIYNIVAHFHEMVDSHLAAELETWGE